MADLKAVEPALKIAGKVIVTVGTAITVVKPVVDDVLERRKRRLAAMVKIPVVYSKSKNVTTLLDQATGFLEERQLTPVPNPILVPDVKYKDCLVSQVVGTEPKGGQMVDPGTLVYVRYLPADTIEKSQALFEQNEEKKAELKHQRQVKKDEQKERTRQVLEEAKERFAAKREEQELP